LRLLFIGLGSIAKKHIKSINTIDDKIEIFALRHSVNSKIIKGVKSFFNWTDINFVPDGILICNPTHFHEDAIKNALQFNCPLFIEKPALQNLRNAEKLIEYIENKKIITYVGLDLRFHPSVIFFKSYCEKHDMIINEVNVYCGSYLPEWRSKKDFKKSYSSIPELGGGVHLDLIHEIDLCYWLFGLPLKINSILQSKSSLGINSIDYANYVLEYENFCASIILNYYRRDYKREVEIVTNEKSIKLDLRTGYVKDSEGHTLFYEEVSFDKIYLNQMKHFLYCIQNKIDSINNFKESINVIKICLNETS
jgi:predicted dehydrogenase